MVKNVTPGDRKNSAVTLAVAVLGATGTLSVQRNELLSVCIWKWTEAHGKYKGCRFWTRKALAAKSHKELAHEHVVPRRLVVEQLCAIADPDEAAVRELFEAMAVACVVTRDEHRNLPEVDWEELVTDPWARYEYADVEVVDTWDEGT